MKLILWGDGVHNDTDALSAALSGGEVYFPDGTRASPHLTGKKFLITRTIYLPSTPYSLQDCEVRFIVPSDKGPLFVGDVAR